MMNKPMNQVLTEQYQDIIDMEKRKQAIVLEFLPDYSNVKQNHLQTLDRITDQVIKLESIIGKERRMTHFSFELEGLNIRQALFKMSEILRPIMEDKKSIDKLAKENSERWNTLVHNTEKKF